MTTLSKARLRYLMPIELIKFLKKEKALCAFMNAFVSNYKKYPITDEEFIVNLFKSSNAIICSFIWIKYPHKVYGSSYWAKLNIKWYNYLNDKYKGI